MPREVTDIKSFIEICRRKDASSARIKKNRSAGINQTKFKAEKLKQSLPPGLSISETPKKNARGKRVAKSS
ncbi:hypothetical protein BST61_g9680 [Cercospora zeina]